MFAYFKNEATKQIEKICAKFIYLYELVLGTLTDNKSLIRFCQEKFTCDQNK